MSRKLSHPLCSALIPLFSFVFAPLLQADTNRSVGRILHGYHHKSWGSDAGIGAVYDVQQAPNGFLWLTTSRGIIRFDGVHFESIDEVTSGAAINRDLDSMFVARNGDLWLTTRTAGMLLWRNGRIAVFPDRACTPSLKTSGIVEALDGSLWMQTRSGLAHLHGSKCEQIGREHGLSGSWITGLVIDHTGTLLVETRPGLLLRMRPGDKKFSPVAQGNPTIDSVFLHEDAGGSLWLADAAGVRKILDRPDAPFKARSIEGKRRRQSAFGNFAFAQDGALWVGTKAGLVRFDAQTVRTTATLPQQSEARVFSQAQGLSSNAIWKILVDAEGSIWVGSNGGLDQLRPVPLHSIQQPPTQETQMGIASGEGGAIFEGSRTLPLTRIDESGKHITYPEIRLLTVLRADRDGGLWVGGDSQLWHLRNSIATKISYPEEHEHAPASVTLDRKGNLWLLLLGGSTYYRQNDIWYRQNAILGRKPGVLGAMTGDEEGNVWLAFSNRLVRWNGDHFDWYSFPDGSLNISVYTMSVRQNRVWMGGGGGVLLFSNGSFRLLTCKDEEMPGRASGVLETDRGDLWINGYSGITHVSAEELQHWLRDPQYKVHADRLNALDGLHGFAADRTPEPSVIQARDGRLWFATTRSIAWLDPAALDELRNRVAPHVEMISIDADGKTYRGGPDVRLQSRLHLLQFNYGENAMLPPLTRSIRFNYTALSLSIPERVKFRYRLDGFDRNWSEETTTRQAIYNNLNPGTYRFNVIACNGDGVWNQTGATMVFTLLPAWYQTGWFTFICAALGLLIVWVAYRLRLRQVARTIRVRFNERLAERTRIAQELHDSLLQTIQGSLLLSDNALERRSDTVLMEQTMERLHSYLDRAVIEGRAALNSLRTSPKITNDLVEAIKRTMQEDIVPESIKTDLVVSGEPKELHPIVFYEIDRIAHEAVRNACLHSSATKLSIDIRYGRDLILQIIDNGCGISSQIVSKGKPEHFGLIGMQERAEKIRGKLEIFTNGVTGTTIRLRVPGRIAFVTSTSKWSTWER